MSLSPYYTARLLILLMAAITFEVAWWLSGVVGVPPEPGYQASLALQENVVLSFLSAVGLVAVAAALGTVVAGRIRFNAGLLAAGVALGALSMRGGPSRLTYLYAMATREPPAIFLRLALEVVLVGLILGGVWWVLRRLHVSGTLKDRESESMLEAPGHAAAIEMTALAVQAAITMGGVLFLAQTDSKMQVMMAVLVASMIGSAVTHSIYATGPRSAYWAPPLVVGLIGYLLAVTSIPRGMETADFKGVFVALVRPMPLDWASGGVAGAIVGHWMSRRWLKERQAMSAGAAEGGAAGNVSGEEAAT